ncbi:MAG TPA: ATP-dependent DNA ligase [Myxococcaceae bacterium]|nr:ATP-dependent DNA ligase [Myxococcaceae bacterium]
MKRFAELYEALDSTTSTLAKVDALARYFREAPPADAAWALWVLTGRRLKRLLNVRQLVDWTRELTGIPDWMLSECYAVVGDLAETISLLLDTSQAAGTSDVPLSVWMAERIVSLRSLDGAAQRERVLQLWSGLSRQELFLVNKLLTGELRVGVSETLVIRALAQVAGLPAPVVAQRLMGEWTPSAELFAGVLGPGQAADDVSRPYPFFLASPLEGDPAELGDRAEWLAEWKWDGIRGQLIRRAGRTFLWSRGEELIGERFPELLEAAARLPDGVVLDGEVMAYGEAEPLPFARLQRRIGRKTLTPRILEEAPAAFIAYDLLEQGGADARELPLSERRSRLEALLLGLHPRLFVSESLGERTWEALAARRAESRARQVEGVMLKRLSSPYRSGRRRGDWWKWKIDPFQIDAVLLYAHPGNGRRANLFTDYTFALWHQGELVPVAKAYSGLSDREIADLDRWIRAHTRERFGPVRAVEPSQVFELHFEGIRASTRHKSGVAVRFPRIARWRTDKPAAEADTLDALRRLALGAEPETEGGAPPR